MNTGTIWKATNADGSWVQFEHGADVFAAMAYATEEFGATGVDRIGSVPVAKKAVRLIGPTWTDRNGTHKTEFVRTSYKADSAPVGSFWRVVDICNGSVFQVADMQDRCPDVCDTPTGALWALRGIVAHWMRSDVRSTRSH